MITTQEQLNGNPKTMSLQVRDITGTYTAQLELDPALRVGVVAKSVASRMSLPTETSWAIRDDRTAAFLDEDAAIGDLLGTEGRPEVSLVPKAHLGSA